MCVHRCSLLFWWILSPGLLGMTRGSLVWLPSLRLAMWNNPLSLAPGSAWYYVPSRCPLFYSLTCISAPQPQRRPARWRERMKCPCVWMGRKDFLQETRGAFKLALVSHRGSNYLQVLSVKLQPFFLKRNSHAGCCLLRFRCSCWQTFSCSPVIYKCKGGGATAPAGGTEINCRAAFWSWPTADSWMIF